MTQLDLNNIETKTCPKCKLGMKCESLIDDEITYFCPTCLKEYKFTVCLNCGVLFDTNGYRMCEQCNAQAIQRVERDARTNNQQERPTEVYIVKPTSPQ